MKIPEKFDSWSLDDLFGITRCEERWIELDLSVIEDFKGGTLHPEICKAISEAKKGCVFTEEHKRNLSIALSNLKRQPTSDETKQKIAESKRGIPRDESTKEIISEKTREAMNKMCEETYRFISPEGEEFVETTTLSDFARRHNLNKSLLNQVKNGKRNHTGGWKVFPLFE